VNADLFNPYQPSSLSTDFIFQWNYISTAKAVIHKKSFMSISPHGFPRERKRGVDDR
jgi:hypothetical protein